MSLMHISEIDYVTMECTVWRQDMVNSEMEVVDGRHVIKGATATADFLAFWQLMSGLRQDWLWYIRIFVLRDPAVQQVELEPNLQDWIEMGAAPEQHCIWEGASERDRHRKAYERLADRRGGAGRGRGGRGRGRGRAAIGGAGGDAPPLAVADLVGGGAAADLGMDIDAVDEGEDDSMESSSSRSSRADLTSGSAESEVDEEVHESGSDIVDDIIDRFGEDGLLVDREADDFVIGDDDGGGDGILGGAEEEGGDADEPAGAGTGAASSSGAAAPVAPPPPAAPVEAAADDGPPPKAARVARAMGAPSLAVPFASGAIVFYYSNGNFMAQCGDAAHGPRCSLTRTCAPGKRRGQGRCLGLLAAWLLDPDLHGQSKASRDWLRPTYDQRLMGRQLLRDAPNSEVLFGEERDSQLGPLDEPPSMD